MKIAALYDIHGNLPALNAVLAELEGVQPDVVVIGGDIVSGPMPRQQLERSQRDFLAQLPEQITIHVEGLGDVLFCHATPRSDEEIFTPITLQERLNTIFAGIEQQIVVCGHTHMQFEQRVGSVRIVNAGSVGMPYADRPGAYWLLVGPEGSEFRRTEYDVETAAQQVRESGYPQAQDFAGENVLKVPSAAEATEIFERMAAN